MRFRVAPTRVPDLGVLRLAARSLRIEWEHMVDDMRSDAVVEASGPYTERELRRMDHPYARRHGKAKLPLLPININTGRLLRSMRVMRRKTVTGTVWQLQFMAPHGKFVLAPDGTKYMLPRGYWIKMQQRYRERLGEFFRRVRTYGNA